MEQYKRQSERAAGLNVMKSYEASATVDELGRVQLAGVPFPPGTEVTVTLRLKGRFEDRSIPTDDLARAEARERLWTFA